MGQVDGVSQLGGPPVSDEERRMASEITSLHARVNAGLYPLQNLWRVGRKVGRTIYAQIGAEPSDDDALIGVMDTPGIAQAAVEGHNRLMGSKAGMDT